MNRRHQSPVEVTQAELEKAAEAAHLGRRQFLLGAGALGAAVASLQTFGPLNPPPARREAKLSVNSGARLPDIQFALDDFIGAPAEIIEGVSVKFHPAHQTIITAKLTRNPTMNDRAKLSAAFNKIEDHYEFSEQGILSFISYGIPYFERLPGGMRGALVSAHMPRLLEDPRRYALEEAVPAPTDVHRSNPGISKPRYNIPVRITNDDMTFVFRSDHADHIIDVIEWLGGSNRLAGKPIESPGLESLIIFTSSMVSFVGKGITTQIARQNNLPFAPFMPPDAPIWSGFTCQQTENSSGPAEICTYLGNDTARFTTAQSGDYFDNAGAMHLSHTFLDMMHWYGVNPDGTLDPNGAYFQKVQRMHRSTPPPSEGNEDQYTDGGGTPWLPLVFQGQDDALNHARGIGTPDGERRMGHVAAMHRLGRANDRNNTPLHIRMDSPGWDNIDSPDGNNHPKMQFIVFTPTS
ncbi:MAG: hypothetical protein GEU94_13480, partial [Micromonosporaceae bacterium]|nr:hypothetical protein [Micromonosporaceae bacterium]